MWLSSFKADSGSQALKKWLSSVVIFNTTFPDDILTAVLKIKLDTLKIIRFVIKAHPDWNDEIVAEKVLDLEDEGFDADKANAEDLTTV